jgi:hypothetical protein
MVVLVSPLCKVRNENNISCGETASARRMILIGFQCSGGGVFRLILDKRGRCGGFALDDQINKLVKIFLVLRITLRGLVNGPARMVVMVAVCSPGIGTVGTASGRHGRVALALSNYLARWCE